jgi:hypothetical protein
MGLLDDAIREHLDLKRRRGGDPAEIERAEHEALGPVRRDPFEQAPGDFDRISVADDGLRAYDHEGDRYEDEGYDEYDVEEEWEEEYEEPRGAEQSAAPPSYPTEAGAGGETMQYDVEEALASEAPRAERAPEWVEQSDEWVEQSEEWVEPSQSAEPSAPQHDAATPPHEPDGERSANPEEDVLEETREFRQDAPDHDRLWFEQRPPRDFDFDD